MPGLCLRVWFLGIENRVREQHASAAMISARYLSLPPVVAQDFGRETASSHFPPLSLLLIHKVTAPVLLPASLIRLHAERLLFSVADGLDAAGVDPGRDQGVLHRTRPAIA